MKKTILFLCSILVIGMSACTKTKYVPDPINPNRTYIRSLVAGDWQRQSNNLIFCDIPLSDLTDYYILEGNISVALSTDNEVSYDILPATINAISYTVNYTTGFVTIYADDPLSDPDIQVPIPSNVVVKIVLSDSDFIN